MIHTLEELPDRIKGNGTRADFYTVIGKDCIIALLNDEEFEMVVDHNSKRNTGEDDNAILINNENDSYLIIRESAIKK